METKEILKKVRHIEIKSRRLSDHVFSGAYHSSFKGIGMTFSEVKPYEFGDDIRNIDWNVTAKYNEPFVKVFEEERSLNLMLMVDISASGNFGSNTQLKRETITEIAATLAFSALKNNDKIGLLLFTNEVELFIPPKTGKTHVLRIIREMLEFQPKQKNTNINGALQYLLNVQKKKSIVFLLSDFLDDTYEQTLKMVANKHDLTGIRVYDRLETKLPNIGMITVKDPETGAISWLNTASEKVRKAYQTNYQNQVAFFQNVFYKSGAGYISTRVDENFVKKLLTYFKQRSL